MSTRSRRLAWCVALATSGVVAAEQAGVSASSFQGHDEWPGIELAPGSRRLPDRLR